MSTTLSVPGEITVAPPQKKVRDRRAVGRQSVLIAAGIALIAKLLIAWNTFGNERCCNFLSFRQVVGRSRTGMDLPKHNSLQSSATHRLLSARDLFPPSPSLLEASGITFPFLLRLPGIVADFVVVLVLLQIRENDPRLRLPTWTLVLFALSPLSIMVSGYHGNTDPVMVMLLLFSVYFCTPGPARAFRSFLCTQRAS